MDQILLPPTVTVLMTTFNRAHLIRESIESLLGQTRPPDEIIIVNDGSTDNTADIVQSYGSRIKYVEQPNSGKAAALNRVLPQVESSYVWVFDDDDIALPDALEAHLKFLSEHPQHDFTYSTNYVFFGDFSEKALKQYKLKAFPAIPDNDYFGWIMESAFLPNLMQGMLIPTNCYRVVGAFDEALLRGQDCDMVLRIARRFRAGRVDQPTFAERVHDGERGPAFERHAERDRYQVWRRYKCEIFKKLRSSLLLAEYLPKRAASAADPHALSAIEERDALLQRGLIMSVHGLFQEMLEDFAEYVCQLDSSSSKSSEKEQQKISRMNSAHDPDAMPSAGYYRRLGALCRGRPDLLKAAVRGLYWSIAQEAGRRRAVLVGRLLGFATILITAYLAPGAQRSRDHGV